MHALVGVSPFAFLAASQLVILAPGPDMTLVAHNTIARGCIAGMQTAGGALLGVSVHVFAAVAGLSAILTGCALVHRREVRGRSVLGARTFLASRHGRDGEDQNDERELFGEASPRLLLTPSSPVMQGVLSAVLNPKLAVFFLTFLPQFVDPHNLPEASMLVHGAIFVSMAAAWLTLWVLTLDRLGRRVPPLRLCARGSSARRALCSSAWACASRYRPVRYRPVRRWAVRGAGRVGCLERAVRPAPGVARPQRRRDADARPACPAAAASRRSLHPERARYPRPVRRTVRALRRRGLRPRCPAAPRA